MANTNDCARVAIACQGGGSHAAFTAGVLETLLAEQEALPKEQGAGRFEVTGLSGTSGGAMCALLGWYGLLEGGASKAAKRLDGFWADSEPQLPWEDFWNWMAVRMAESPVELKTSPYEWPASWTVDQLRSWSRESRMNGSPMNGLPWIDWLLDLSFPRREYVDLRALLEKHICVADLERISGFLRIEQEVKRWRVAQEWSRFGLDCSRVNAERGDEASMMSLVERVAAVLEPGLMKRFSRIEGLERRLKAMKRMLSAASVQSWGDPRFVAKVEQSIGDATRQIPLLYLGAVNICDGEFKAFSSKKGEIGVEAALASAALPLMFRAVTDDQGREYWDGIFSQNPPIANFLAEADSADDKPDEIWVVQINPQGYSTIPATGTQIEDRRNSLAGNLSLNQEIGAINTINRLLLEGAISGCEDRGRAALPSGLKRVAVHRIRMNTGLLGQRWQLGQASKVDRNPAFLRALRAHGIAQAKLFLPVRGFIEEVWNQPDRGAQELALAQLFAGKDIGAALSQVNAFRAELKNFAITANDLSLEPAGEGAGAATLRWQADGIVRDGQRAEKRVTLTGQAHFAIADGKVKAVRFTPRRVEAIKEIGVVCRVGAAELG